MKKFNFYMMTALVGAFLFAACGGGGVSEEFTKEINDFETAWTNTGNSFNAAVDSVKAAKAGCETMTAEMKLPDSVAATITPEYGKQLDSVKAVCTAQGAVYDGILTGAGAFGEGWAADTKAFAEWKDKVFKGEIDVETAKKDLESYKTKVNDATTRISEITTGLNAEQAKCSANCKAYNDMVANIPARTGEPKKHR